METSFLATLGRPNSYFLSPEVAENAASAIVPDPSVVVAILFDFLIRWTIQNLWVIMAKFKDTVQV